MAVPIPPEPAEEPADPIKPTSRPAPMEYDPEDSDERFFSGPSDTSNWVKPVGDPADDPMGGTGPACPAGGCGVCLHYNPVSKLCQIPPTEL